LIWSRTWARAVVHFSWYSWFGHALEP